MIRSAKAHWSGTGKEGKGHLTTASTVLEKTAYSFNTRFENGKGTNPEELVAAAHAGCFTMKLSFNLTAAGFTPKALDTTCEITFADGVITQSHLILKAQVDGIEEKQFVDLVKDAETNCPISKLLNTKITVTHSLN